MSHASSCLGQSVLQVPFKEEWSSCAQPACCCEAQLHQKCCHKVALLERAQETQHAVQVPVNEWRTALWQRALQSLGIDKPQMAEALQERFRASRLEHFVLDTGVKVGGPWQALPPQSLQLMSLLRLRAVLNQMNTCK